MRTPLPDPRPKALLVVENAPRLRASDEKLQARLTSLGFQVQIRRRLRSQRRTGKDIRLIVISESVKSKAGRTRFVKADVPVVVCEPAHFRTLKMTRRVRGAGRNQRSKRASDH